jgi:hypothetical protein
LQVEELMDELAEIFRLIILGGETSGPKNSEEETNRNCKGMASVDTKVRWQEVD